MKLLAMQSTTRVHWRMSQMNLFGGVMNKNWLHQKAQRIVSDELEPFLWAGGEGDGS